jgi:hypothetical protein
MRPTGNASAPVDIRADDNVTFVLAAKTMSPWLALGLSRDGTGMKGMDVALLLRDDVRGHVVTVCAIYSISIFGVLSFQSRILGHARYLYYMVVFVFCR